MTGSAGAVAVAGLAATVAITHADADVDLLAVNGLAGDDTIDASALAADAIKLAVDGGDGDDGILGGAGVDQLTGGGGDDLVDGNRGDDVALLGVGDDTFQWDPGDGSDVVEGQEGADRLLFNGAGVAENVDVSANGARLRFFRDVASITMDTDDVETVDFRALGGADTVTVNDLTGTDVTSVLVDLAGVAGGATGDGALDQVTVNATDGDDSVVVTGSAGAVAVAGLAATVAITHADADDRLDVNTGGGTDVVDTSEFEPGVILSFVDGIAV